MFQTNKITIPICNKVVQALVQRIIGVCWQPTCPSLWKDLPQYLLVFMHSYLSNCRCVSYGTYSQSFERNSGVNWGYSSSNGWSLWTLSIWHETCHSACAPARTNDEAVRPLHRLGHVIQRHKLQVDGVDGHAALRDAAADGLDGEEGGRWGRRHPMGKWRRGFRAERTATGKEGCRGLGASMHEAFVQHCTTSHKHAHRGSVRQPPTKNDIFHSTAKHMMAKHDTSHHIT